MGDNSTHQTNTPSSLMTAQEQQVLNDLKFKLEQEQRHQAHGPVSSIQQSSIPIPSATTTLVSNGVLYPEGHPLRSGQVELRYPRAVDEAIFSNPNYLRQGTAFDRFLTSISLTPFDPQDLVGFDRQGLILAARVLTYGRDYTVNIFCEDCEEKNIVKTDVSLYTEAPPKTETMIAPNLFEYVLPYSKMPVSFKFFDRKDELKVEERIKEWKRKNKKVPPPVSTLNALYHIQSIGGSTNFKDIEHYILNELLALDQAALYTEMSRVSAEIKVTTTFECSNCGHENKDVEVPISATFLSADRDLSND